MWKAWTTKKHENATIKHPSFSLDIYSHCNVHSHIAKTQKKLEKYKDEIADMFFTLVIRKKMVGM